MRSHMAVVPRVLGVFLLAAVGLIGMAPNASAQTVCSEAPFLAAVDSNGDGIASIDEIRAVAPDNAELQGAADSLAGAGYSGIQYQGCGETGGGTTGGGGGTTGGDEGTSGGDEGVTGGAEGAGAGETEGEGTRSDGTGQAGTTDAGTESTDGPTEQEQAYIDALLADMGEMVQVATAIDGLFSEVETDPTRLEDEEWNTQVEEQLSQWQQLAADAETLEPSERQQHIHAIWLSITALVGLAVDDITVGMEEQNQETLTRATDRLTYVTLLLEDLGGSITGFQDDPNAPHESEYALNPVQDCSAFWDYELAQQYYAAWPEEQPTIDPDLDGLACEVFFEVE